MKLINVFKFNALYNESTLWNLLFTFSLYFLIILSEKKNLFYPNTKIQLYFEAIFPLNIRKNLASAKMQRTKNQIFLYICFFFVVSISKRLCFSSLKCNVTDKLENKTKKKEKKMLKNILNK